MNKKFELIYEGKAKKVFTHDDANKVKIEFKDEATAFNALKKEKFEGKGKLNCLISARIFEILIKKNIPTHFIELENENTMIAKKIKVLNIKYTYLLNKKFLLVFINLLFLFLDLKAFKLINPLIVRTNNFFLRVAHGNFFFLIGYFANKNRPNQFFSIIFMYYSLAINK